MPHLDCYDCLSVTGVPDLLGHKCSRRVSLEQCRITLCVTHRPMRIV